MKTKIFLLISALAAALMVLSFSSCKKDTNLIEQPTIDLVDDDAVTEAVYEDVFSTADNATIILDLMAKAGDTKSEAVADSCPVITVTHPATGIWPKVVTVNYGVNCVGLNNNVRSGKILIVVTGPRNQVGSKRTVTFDNYFFNGIKVEGTKVIENVRLVNNQNPVISVKLTGGKLTLPDGKTIERSLEHQREWTAGFLTRYIWDDECLITGVATGKNINGLEYKNTIMTALHWKRACLFIVSGIVKIEREGAQAVELNYGTGDCDAKAVITRGEESKEILLKNKHRTMKQ